MASDKKPLKQQSPASGHKASTPDAEAPGWADGLKQLYDSVVEEPLPDSFLELLDQFDEVGDSHTGKGADTTENKSDASETRS